MPSKFALLAVMTVCVTVVAASPYPRPPPGFKSAEAAGPAVESHAAAADPSFRSSQFINRFNKVQQMNQDMAREQGCNKWVCGTTIGKCAFTCRGGLTQSCISCLGSSYNKCKDCFSKQALQEQGFPVKSAAAAGPAVESHAAAADPSFRSSQFINRFNKVQQMNQDMAREQGCNKWVCGTTIAKCAFTCRGGLTQSCISCLGSSYDSCKDCFSKQALQEQGFQVD